MDTKEILKKVRKIEIKTKKLSDNIFGGEYHSAFKGRGMTFSEVRPYQYGDDIRNIDWNVTARYNETYVKVFEEERELTLMLLVDVSGSELFGSLQQFKNEILTEIAATLAFSALQNNDKTGLILFSDQIELYIPPKKGKSHILRIIRELIEFQPKNRHTDIAKAFEFLNKVTKKKTIAFVLSDFIGSNYQKPLQIAARCKRPRSPPFRPSSSLHKPPWHSISPQLTPAKALRTSISPQLTSTQAPRRSISPQLTSEKVSRTPISPQLSPAKISWRSVLCLN